jgi:hypothetical protein
LCDIQLNDIIISINKFYVKESVFEMAENNNEFHDPLDDVIARATQHVTGNENNQSINTETPIVNEPEKVEESYQEEPDINIIPNDLLDDLDIDDDDEFGNNDFEKEMAAEEERLAVERAKQVEEAKKAAEVVKTKLPPQSLDKNFQREAIDFQADNLAIVTGMIEKVKAKYHLRGGIPEIKQPPVMGDLMEEYYINGETITEKFEKIFSITGFTLMKRVMSSQILKNQIRQVLLQLRKN